MPKINTKDMSRKYIECELPNSHSICEFLETIKKRYTKQNCKNYWEKKFVTTTQNEYYKIAALNQTCLYDSFLTNDNVLEVTKIAAKILCSNGLCVETNFEENEINVEFHYATTDGKEIAESEFSIHKDNYGGIQHKVHTLLCYFGEYEGGELGIYKNDESLELIKKINTSNKDLNTRKIILLNGCVAHMPLPLYKGTRCAISFQIKQKEVE